MKLVLRLSSGPGGVVGSQASHTFDAFGGSVGRGNENIWMLPDPARKLSRKHFIIDFSAGAYWLTDTSANGVFLNYSTQRLEQGRRIRLNNGDHLGLGDYEIDVWIGSGSGEEINSTDTFAAVLSGKPPAALKRKDDLDGFLDPPPASAAGAVASQPFSPNPPPPAAPPGQTAATWPSFEDDEDDWLFKPHPAAGLSDRAAFSDHVPVENEHYRPPPPVAQPLPADLRGDSLPPSPAMGGALPDDFGADLDDLLGDVDPRSGGPVAPSPFLREPPPVAVVIPAAVPAFVDSPVSVADHSIAETAVRAAAPPVELDAALRAFFEGVGMAPSAGSEQSADVLLKAVGTMFRHWVTGLRELLQVRAEIKNEMHVERTMIRSGGNNPLKCFATDEEVLAALLGPEKRGYLAGPAALAEALDDLKAHEMAMMSGFQETLMALLTRLDPEAFERRLPAGGLIPASRKAKAWDAYRAFYAHSVEECRDDPMRAVGKEFANIYRRQARKTDTE